MKRIIVLLLIIINLQGIKSQSLEFFREDITFKLTDRFFVVDGTYHFCNVSNDTVNASLYYPFPDIELYGQVDSISIIDLETLKPIEYFSKNKLGIYFKIGIIPYGINKYRIKYRQKLKENKAEYILSTTQAWRNPFEVATYKLVVLDGIKVKSLSYEADSIIRDNKNQIYYWNKRDFMPNKNMVIEFEIK